MILSCAAGGTLAVVIGCWAQLRYRTDSVNANEIANGILSCLVAITASCPFVTYWAACLIGSKTLQHIDIISYHGINKAMILHLGPTSRNCDHMVFNL